MAEKTFIGVEFRVPDVEFEGAVTNTVLGYEVPGRRLTVKIRLDCDVECRVDAANIKIGPHEDKDFADTVVVTVPQLELIGRVPEGREYQYEVDRGWSRAKWLDSDDARTFRKDMEARACRKAVEEFGKGEAMTEFKAGFKRELRTLLKPALPKGHRIDVKFGGE